MVLQLGQAVVVSSTFSYKLRADIHGPLAGARGLASVLCTQYNTCTHSVYSSRHKEIEVVFVTKRALCTSGHCRSSVGRNAVQAPSQTHRSSPYCLINARIATREVAQISTIVPPLTIKFLSIKEICFNTNPRYSLSHLTYQIRTIQRQWTRKTNQRSPNSKDAPRQSMIQPRAAITVRSFSPDSSENYEMMLIL